MTQSRLTVADVFRAHGKEFLKAYEHRLPAYQKQALWLLSHCQTETLGSTVRECTSCGHREVRWNSCRHRGCPQCEGSKEALWLLEREDELLPTHYFHVVFTVPHVLNDIILQNQRECFSLLFKAVSKALQTVAKKRLDAKLGFFCLLHTWGQKMDFHPHIHCVLPGGGLSYDANQWISTSKKRRYFAPTKVLAAVFRGIFIKGLKRLHQKGRLIFVGNFDTLINLSVKRKWVVHAQPPFGSPLHVLKYLSRYTRKVCLSNSRLVSFDHSTVTFSYKDYADEGTLKNLTLHAHEFIRRFLMHIPQLGFVRIRYFGFMAGKNRKERLSHLSDTILGLLPSKAIVHSSSDSSFNPGLCPLCKAKLIPLATILPTKTIWLNSS